MEIRLLYDEYKNDESLYEAFLQDNVCYNERYFSNDTLLNEPVHITEAPDFPIYMGKGSEEYRRKDFMEASEVISKSYIKTDRDIHMNEFFWHSLPITKKRDYILENYPDVKKSYSNFRNIVIKRFDWENYIYKCVLAVEYVENLDKYYNLNPDYDLESYNQLKKCYYNLIIDNLDIFNYMIKYSVFRNGKFILNILRAIGELDISDIMKAKIKDRLDLGNDERYGRRVIFELNKRYPVVMSPLMDYETLKGEVINALGNYYDTSKIRV